MISRWLLASVLTLTGQVVTAQDLRGMAQSYLSELVTAAAKQRTLSKPTSSAAFTALLAEDDRWINPRIKPGVGDLMSHMLIHGVVGAEAGEIQWAFDAARVPVTLTHPGTGAASWPAEVDFIRVKGNWSLRALHLTQRRPTAVDATARVVVDDWVAAVIQAGSGFRDLDPDTWLADAVMVHWTRGGGYWQRAGDCSRAERDQCLSDMAGAVTLWTHAVNERDKTISVEKFTEDPARPTAILRVETPRRTMVQVNRYQVFLAKNRRHGWQIASLSALDVAAPPEVSLAELDQSSGEALVLGLVAALLQAETDPIPGLLAGSDPLARYFAETRDGRKAMARVMALRPLALALKLDVAVPEVTSLGNGRYRLTFAGSGNPAIQPVFITVQGDTGVLIEGIE